LKVGGKKPCKQNREKNAKKGREKIARIFRRKNLK
jgi:hypothetical protein